jgi:inner membrane protein involved in colicin E2 resistance
MTFKREPLWHVELAIIVAIVLQFSLASQLSFIPNYLLATFEILLLIGIHFSDATAQEQRSRPRRVITLFLAGIVTIANIASLVMLSRFLVEGTRVLTGHQLIISALRTCS